LGLLEVLRTSPRITADRVKTMTFSDYLSGLEPPLSVNTVRLSGLRGTSMVNERDMASISKMLPYA